MTDERIRQELYEFYLCGDRERAEGLARTLIPIMESRFTEGMSVTEQKLLQYDVITEGFAPKIFRCTPYYYETSVLTSLSDGARRSKGHGFIQANGWVYTRNEHLFREQDEQLYGIMSAQKEELLYLICGPYNDTTQHFNFNFRPILKDGLSGVYNRAAAELARARDDEGREFLAAVMHGMLSLRRMAERFSEKARELLESETDSECRENLALIADTASRVPWEKPTTLYEALATLAFLRTAIGTLEGVGLNTFGRLDVDLIDFYKNDIQNGTITHSDAYGLIYKFLMIWDCHYDHDMIMAGYADHELENTYTLGGCDALGNPVYNEITALFLRATREKGIIFPKIKCRFSQNSPKEYLDLVSAPIIGGTSTVLLQNDDATISSLVRAGKTLTEARDYRVAGCWDIVIDQERADHGCYLNLLKPFEFALHRLTEKMERVGLVLEFFDGADSFDELYRRVLSGCERLIDLKLDVKRRGGGILHLVNSTPIYSSTLEDCISNQRDYARGGAKYYDDYQLLFGLPNIVDSLMAIKTLVFDSKKYTLEEYLTAVRANWDGYEKMRRDALLCHGWGDGNADSTELAHRFNSDLYRIFSTKKSPQGGRVHMGHLTYTEIRWWGEKTLATPDGRRSGEYFSQGLTPSRLKRIPCVLDVVNSMRALDGSMMASNSVVNIIIPSGITTDACETFLRSVADSAVESLQLNCTSKEELLDAQVHPEKYPDLIVRVTGFSAKFTSLSREWQNEFISRNFYAN